MDQIERDHNGSSSPISLLKEGHPTAHSAGLCADVS